MSCYNPNYMYINNNPVHPERKFIPHNKMNDNFYKNKFNLFEKVVPIPCGCCIGCRLDYSRNWANRCYLESLSYKNNYFITFTYNDENLPIGGLGNASLCYQDFVDFMKRLRIHFFRKYKHTGIKYLVAGEYGSATFRPHYHAIIFNLPIFDLSEDFSSIDEDGSIKICQMRSNGSIYYYSKEIEKLWSKGNILIGEATWQSMAYVSRYIVKKQLGKERENYKLLGIEEEVLRCSKGIGKEYYLSNRDKIYLFDNLNVIHDNPVSIKPPRYFDTMFKNDFPYEFKEIKKRREAKQDSSYITNEVLYHHSFNDLNKIKNDNKEIKTEILKRVL